MPPSQAAHLGTQIQTPLLQNPPTLGVNFLSLQTLNCTPTTPFPKL